MKLELIILIVEKNNLGLMKTIRSANYTLTSTFFREGLTFGS